MFISKLLLHSGSADLKQMGPIHKKGAIKFFLFFYFGTKDGTFGSNDLVVMSLDYQCRGPGFNTTRWFYARNSLLSF